MAIAEDYNFESLNIISGNLEVRLAENSLEIDAAQALRYKVFFEEMNAVARKNQKMLKRDIDIYDHFFDHILVIDHDLKGKIHKKVVGTYRLNRGLKNKKSRNAGHKAGLSVVELIINESIKQKIKFLTLYAFSTENWSRPKAEIKFGTNFFL